MASVTAEDVQTAEQELLDAKKARGDRKSGKAVEEYLVAADNLTMVRRAFREQEEQAGRRTTIVTTGEK